MASGAAVLSGPERSLYFVSDGLGRGKRAKARDGHLRDARTSGGQSTYASQPAAGERGGDLVRQARTGPGLHAVDATPRRAVDATPTYL